MGRRWGRWRVTCRFLRWLASRGRHIWGHQTQVGNGKRTREGAADGRISRCFCRKEGDIRRRLGCPCLVCESAVLEPLGGSRGPIALISMALKLEIERPKLTSHDVLLVFVQESPDCYEANDGSDETFETMGNDEDSGTGGQTRVGNGRPSRNGRCRLRVGGPVLSRPRPHCQTSAKTFTYGRYLIDPLRAPFATIADAGTEMRALALRRIERSRTVP